MNEDIQNKAEKIVELFKNELNSSSRQYLNDSDYKRLITLIATAICEERLRNANLIEEFAGSIKSDIKKFDMAL